MKRQAISILAAGLCLAVVFGWTSVASACPSCQQALSGGEHGDLARGIYYSVLFMMAMPFAIVGTFASLAYRAVKREQKRLADQNQLHDEQRFDN
ncbi:MAG: hypothetical protein AB7O59_04960 [Pirellulales bacterium]